MHTTSLQIEHKSELSMQKSYYEFFAGGGMVRAGLGCDWKCLFANDFDYKKSETYRKNWGSGELITTDVREVELKDIPGRANLIWGSFPCQDLSLAGSGAGLKGNRSGTFWPFWDIVKGIIEEGRGPEIIALENVVGTLHSHDGKDFISICNAFNDANYYFGAIVIDANLFLPQSRPRLFIIGVNKDNPHIDKLCSLDPNDIWHTKTLIKAYNKLSNNLKTSWVWWNLPMPPRRKYTFSDLVEENPKDVRWHTPEETKHLLDMMNIVNRKKVKNAELQSRETGKVIVGTIYKRTRQDENGFRIQRAEVRFDDVAGCLRTPAGGSSRQLIIVVDGELIRSRLISTRETARLMGLPENYILPKKYNEAYQLTGDGVAVPVIEHINKYIFSPLLNSGV